MIFYNIRRRRRRENFFLKENVIEKVLLTLWGLENYPKLWPIGGGFLNSPRHNMHQLPKPAKIETDTNFLFQIHSLFAENFKQKFLSSNFVSLTKSATFWSFFAKFLKDVDNKSQYLTVTFEFWCDSAKILKFGRFTLQFYTQISQGWWLSNYRIDISIRYWVYRYRY